MDETQVPVSAPIQIVSAGTATPIPPDPNRPKPEDWREWPVIPVPSARARQIYQQGIANGTNASHVSKVGDCQAIQEVLLGRYDKPGTYRLRENAEQLTETIQHFSGSFGRDGEAVQGGFNAASELSPIWSNPAVCDPGESPLECEIRVHNPSIMLISLEVWWDGRSPQVYENNMRQIIELAISRGILPILSTKADNVEGDHSINLATAKLAYEYDLPLWNWWLAAQSLPNRGLDPDRPDGFHISLDSWDERSFTALQSIDSVWRGVTIPADDSPKMVAEIADPFAAAADEQACGLVVTPGADCAETGGLASTVNSAWKGQAVFTPVTTPALFNDPAGYILMSFSRRAGGVVTPGGVLLINPSNGSASPILPEGTALQAVSPDRRQILYSHGSDLVLADLDGSLQSVISERFISRGSTAAAWHADGKSVLHMTKEGDDTYIVQYPLDGSSSWKRLSAAGETPINLIASPDTARVFWVAGDCSTMAVCAPIGVRVSGLDGSVSEFLPGAAKAVFSPDGRMLVYEETTPDKKNLLTLASSDLSSRRPMDNIGMQFQDYSWSPDGSRLSILTLNRSEYSGLMTEIRNLVINPVDMGTKILPVLPGINNRATWSPGGTQLLLTTTQQVAEGYAINIQVMDISNGATRDITSTAGLTGSDFLFVTAIHWVKPVE
jgi:Tol biopolymer transport system component